MTQGPEAANGGETVDVATRFKAFVEARSFPSFTQHVGDLKHGFQPIKDAAQLIPVTTIEYTKFHTSGTEQIDESKIGYSITLSDGSYVRYSLEYMRGTFLEDISGEFIPVDPSVATNLMDAIEAIEIPAKRG